jgi:hypothetical protein
MELGNLVPFECDQINGRTDMPRFSALSRLLP